MFFFLGKNLIGIIHSNVLYSKNEIFSIVFLRVRRSRISKFSRNLDMLSQNLNPLELKLAEKLTILNDRAVGVLTRTSNIKKARKSPDSHSPGSRTLELLTDLQRAAQSTVVSHRQATRTGNQGDRAPISRRRNARTGNARRADAARRNRAGTARLLLHIPRHTRIQGKSTNKSRL